MSAPLTPEERAALRVSSEWLAAQGFADIAGPLWRLLDERDALAARLLRTEPTATGTRTQSGALGWTLSALP